jgi:hypothetical protein
MRCSEPWKRDISWFQGLSPDRKRGTPLPRLVSIADQIRWPPGVGIRIAGEVSNAGEGVCALNLPQDVATAEGGEASWARAPNSPWEGEGMDARTARPDREGI